VTSKCVGHGLGAFQKALRIFRSVGPCAPVMAADDFRACIAQRWIVDGGWR
jgi:hypothetical protein